MLVFMLCQETYSSKSLKYKNFKTGFPVFDADIRMSDIRLLDRNGIMIFTIQKIGFSDPDRSGI